MKKTPGITSALFTREFMSVFIVIVNAFSWYFPLYIFFESILETLIEPNLFPAVFGIQFAAAVGFAILNTILIKRFPRRDKLIVVWMLLGIVASLSLIMVESFSTTYLFIVSFLLGTALGFGFPTGLACFGDQSSVENRGWLGGITFFGSGVFILLIGVLLNFSNSVFIGALLLAIWRAIGLLLFLLIRRKEDYVEKGNVEVSFLSVLQDRSFLLYLLPWIMFCITNFLERPIVNGILGSEIASFVPIAEYGTGGIIALVGGKFADSVGRKRIVIVGFISLGIGYALLGLFPTLDYIGYLYIVLDAIAWGIFSLMFYLVIWSELARNRTKEKYYLLGILPFLIASFIQVLFTPFAEGVEVSTAFSLASFFLFIAVLPLLYAPETMPEKNIELKRLRKFAEEARKAKEKYENKKNS